MKKIALVCAAVAVLSGAALAEDGYVESDGAECVILGHFIGPKTKIELDFALTEVENGARFFGSAGGSTNPRCRLYVGTNSSGDSMLSLSTIDASGTEKASNLYLADTARHTAIVDYAATSEQFRILTDGVQVAAATFASFLPGTSIRPLGVFAENVGTSGIYADASSSSFLSPAKMKVYGIKIYEDGVETKDFVPCVKGGVAGFKEAHSGMFHTTERYAALAYGGEISVEKDDPYVSAERNVIGTGAETNTFIDTGYAVRGTTRVELDYAIMTNCDKNAVWPDSICPYLISAQTKTSEKTYNFVLCVTNAGHLAYRLGETAIRDIPYYTITNAYGIRRTVSIDSNTVVFVTAGYTNMTVSAVQYGIPPDASTMQRSLKIGATFAGTSRYLPMRIYGLKIFESGSLVKDYVPFVVNGVGGLKNSLDETDRLFSLTRTSYKDSLSDGAATNTVFDVGGNVACSDGSDDAYLEFDGVNGHSIETGYPISTNSAIEIDYAHWSTRPNGWQYIFEQRGTDGIFARAYVNSSSGDNILNFAFCDRSAGDKVKSTGFRVNNYRTQLMLDSPGNSVRVVNNGEEKWNHDMDYYYANPRVSGPGTAKLWVGAGAGGTAHAAAIRLYGLKIYEYEGGERSLARNYIPYVRNGEAGLYETVTTNFYPLAGGKVSGGTASGEPYAVMPQPMKVSTYTKPDKRILRCVAKGAQRYQWYEDGVAMPGAESETLTVEWRKIASPSTVTYSVRPVYTIFNETVYGDEATATVTMSQCGLGVFFK